MTEVKELNKWKITLCSYIGRLNIFKMSGLDLYIQSNLNKNPIKLYLLLFFSQLFVKPVKRREAKSKEEKERYKHLNAELQRIARRGKKAFLSDQCKEIEENNRMGKTRALFKKIRDTKGTFHATMGSIKDRNGMDLTEAEDIKRGGKNTQKNCTKKIFTTQIIMMV